MERGKGIRGEMEGRKKGESDFTCRGKETGAEIEDVDEMDRNEGEGI